MHFRKGEEVWILDFPFGKPLKIKGVVVGNSGEEHYNVLIKTGLLEGDVVRYKYWKLSTAESRKCRLIK